jgi:hypothetical protein
MFAIDSTRCGTVPRALMIFLGLNEQLGSDLNSRSGNSKSRVKTGNLTGKLISRTINLGSS